MVWLQLIRWKNLGLILIGQIFVIWKLYGNNYFTLPAILYIISTFCFAAAGNIINDVFDIIPDRVNKPNKVIVGKNITKKYAIIAYRILNGIGLILSIWCSLLLKNSIFMVYIIWVVVLLYFYSKTLKGKPVVGNITIALFTSLSLLLFLNIFKSTSKQVTIIYILSSFCFLMNWVREMVKDIEDIKGDQQANLKTLPIITGKFITVLVAKIIISILLILFVLLMFVTQIEYLKVYIFITLITPTAYCLKLLKKNTKQRDFSLISKILKLTIGFGVFSLLLI